MREEMSRAAGRREQHPEWLLQVMDVRVRGREGGVSEEEVEERRECRGDDVDDEGSSGSQP